MTTKMFGRWKCLPAGLAFVGLTGCAVTWDDVTSRNFEVSSLWTAPPPPLEVLDKSSDGYARAKAIARLGEAKGDAAQYLPRLQALALTDRDPLCRLAAIRALGKYNDPQAARVLSEVYLGNPGLSAENNALVRQQALAALETSAPTEARQLFIKAAKQPGGSLTTAAQSDRQEINDERLTAIRALGKYSQSDAVETLVRLMETEKDVAVKNCAWESVKSATKRDFPNDGKAWREFIATGREPARTSNFSLANLNPLKLEAPAVAPPSPEAAPKATLIPNNVSSDPSVFQKISNWIRPEKTEPQAPAMPPPNFPSQTATPSQPVLSAPNPTLSIPPGSFKNSQGETVIPVNTR